MDCDMALVEMATIVSPLLRSSIDGSAMRNVTLAPCGS
jgi:hypothetical protein